MMNNEQEIGSHVLSYNFNLIKFFWVKQMLCFYFFPVWEKCELFPCEFKIKFLNIFYFLSWNCKGLFTTHKILFQFKNLKKNEKHKISIFKNFINFKNLKIAVDGSYTDEF